MIWNAVVVVVAVVVLASIFRLLFIRHVVSTGQVGLLYRDEKFVKALEPGRYLRFDPFRLEQLIKIDIVPTALSATQYDVISKDQFAFRVTLAPLITITDPREYYEGTPNVSAVLPDYYAAPDMRLSRLNPVISAGILRVVAEKTLEEFLNNPVGAIEGLTDEISRVMPGISLDQLAVTSITLPPEVRKMFTEVERARREGLAGLERSKAEQASLRALANAARNLAGNPQLAQLRMLQTMESAKGAKTFVLGNSNEALLSEEPGQS